MVCTCLAPGEAPTVLAIGDGESLRGWGSLCSWGPAPVYVGLLAFASHPLPAPTAANSLGAWRFLQEPCLLPALGAAFVTCPGCCVRYLPSVLCSLSALGAQHVASSLIQLPCCQKGAIPIPRAPRSAPAARQCLRGSSSSSAEPGQMMLSPI